MALFAWFKNLALDQFFSSSTLVIFFDLSFSFKCAFLMNIVTMSQKLMSWVWNPANCGTWAWISDCWLTSNSLYSSKIATFFVITFFVCQPTTAWCILSFLMISKPNFRGISTSKREDDCPVNLLFWPPAPSAHQRSTSQCRSYCLE